MFAVEFWVNYILRKWVQFTNWATTNYFQYMLASVIRIGCLGPIGLIAKIAFVIYDYYMSSYMLVNNWIISFNNVWITHLDEIIKMYYFLYLYLSDQLHFCLSLFFFPNKWLPVIALSAIINRSFLVKNNLF